MKHILSFFLVGCMLLTLNACSLLEGITPTGSDTPTEVTTAAQIPTVTEATTETEIPSATTVATTPETESTRPTEDASFSVRICREDFPIFDGPSYDYYPRGTVGAAGIYTIVEAVLDSEGNNWGRLKSGAGWVDLSLNEREALNMPPVTISLADEELLIGGNYYYCEADTSAYAYEVAFRAHEILTDVSFFSIDGIDGYKRGPELFRISTWKPGAPFVASVSFPGYSHLFGLEFTDSHGITQVYGISESGRNGSVNIYPITTPLTPTDPVPDSDWGSPAIPDSLNMYFSSGAGAWGTSLTLKGNGNFSGSFHDSNMGETGEGYPHGTCYLCDFTGVFQITGTSTYAVTLSLTDLTVQDYGAEEWIEDNVRYIASDAYGIAGGSNFLLFMPNTPVSELPEDIANWWHGGIPQTGTLGCYALYCVETGYSFLGD